MKFTWSQKSYEVRDASEIALGVLFLAVLLMPLSLLVGAIVLVLWVLIGGAEPSSELYSWTAIVLWCIGMALVLGHYRRVARGWAEERRGSDALSLVEGIAAVVGGVLSLVPLGDAEALLPMVRLFFASLIGVLVLCHCATYAMLRYRPRRTDLLVWGLSAGFVVWEYAR